MKALPAVLLTVVALAVGAYFFFSGPSDDDFAPREQEQAKAAEEEASKDLESAGDQDGEREGEGGDLRRERDGESEADEKPDDGPIVLHVRGRLVDVDGRVIAGCPIHLRARSNSMGMMFFQLTASAQNKPHGEAVSGKDGRFEIGMRKKAGGILKLDSDEWVFPRYTGFDRSVKDIELGDIKAVRAASIEGTIRSSAPFAKAAIRVRQTRINHHATENCEAGPFTVKRLPPGPYSLTVRAPGQIAYRASFELRAGETKRNFDVVLEAGLQLHGQIVDEAGAGIANAQVHVQTERKWDIKNGSFVESNTKSDKNGAFKLTGLNAEEFMVRGHKPGYTGKQIKHKVEDGPVTIRMTRMGSIRGKLVTKDGTEIHRSLIVARKVERNPKKVARSVDYISVSTDGGAAMVMPRLGASAMQTHSKRDGSFTLQGLKAGT